jgi:FtsZ-binding cell division protein ZapB
VLLNCKAHWLSTNTQPSRPLPNVRCDSRNHFARQKIRSLTNAAVQTANLELSRLQKREAVLSERLERRNADLLHETVGAEERIAMLNAGATPRRALEIQIEQLKAKVRHADEVIAQLQRELAGFSGAQRVAELQNLQEIADAREIDSNRRNCVAFERDCSSRARNRCDCGVGAVQGAHFDAESRCAINASNSSKKSPNSINETVCF